MGTLKTSENIRGYSTIESPLNIGIGLYLYQHTSSKKFINFVPDINIRANYKKVIHPRKILRAPLKCGDKKMAFSFLQAFR